MSGITRLSALEIFSNPKDLEIIIAHGKETKKYGFLISRGPGHNFKIILEAKPFSEKPEEVVDTIKQLLEGIQKITKEDLKNKDNLITQILNPDGEELDESNILNQELIDRIIKELQNKKIASTYKMFKGGGKEETKVKSIKKK